MLEILVRASVEGAMLVAAVWAICRFLPRLSPATRTVLWWCAAAKFVLALVWTAPVLVPILPADARPIQHASAIATQVAPAQAVAPGARTSAGIAEVDGGWTRPSRGNPQSAAAWQALALVVVWIAGTIGAVGVGVRRWKQTAGLVARSAGSSPDVEAMAAALASRLGLRRVPRVRVSDEVGTPLVTGILRPSILLPAPAFDALSERQQRMALCHELTHIKRADLWLGCVPAIAERAFFFHPLVHFAAREYALCREAACDAHVLAVLDAAPQEYGRLLLGLGVSRTRTNFAAAGAPWSFSTLRRRIAMLDSPSPRSTGSRVVAAAVIGIAALAIAPLRIAARPAAVDTTIERAAQPPTAGLADARASAARARPRACVGIATRSGPQLHHLPGRRSHHDVRVHRRHPAGETLPAHRRADALVPKRRPRVCRPRSADRRRRDRVVETGERARQSTGRSGQQAGRGRREAG